MTTQAWMEYLDRLEQKFGIEHRQLTERIVSTLLARVPAAPLPRAGMTEETSELVWGPDDHHLSIMITEDLIEWFADDNGNPRGDEGTWKDISEVVMFELSRMIANDRDDLVSNHAIMTTTLTAAQKRGDELIERARSAELRVTIATKKLELLTERTKANILGRNEIERENTRILGILKDPMTTDQLHELYRKEPVE